jgi:uncharacterized protein (TIGR03066 family)
VAAPGGVCTFRPVARSGKENSMRIQRLAILAFLVIGLVIVGTAGAQGDNAKKLVGVWEVTKSEGAPPGATVEFTKDGKVKIKAKVGDKELALDGTYKVKGDKLEVTLEFMGKSKSDTSTIKKLTEKELVLQDDKGKLDEFKRVK